MRYILIQIILFLILVSIASCTPKMYDYTIYSTATGKKLSLRQFARELAQYDVVMFGEFHGNSTIHHIQAELLPLYTREAVDVIISMEMFERDVQRVLDDYLKGEIEEKEFLQKSRPWSSYNVDYRPIVEFAKSEGIPVIASNVPRRFASQVNRFGVEWLEEVPVDERFLFAEYVTLTDDQYRDKFFILMSESPHISTHDHLMMADQLTNLYAAQSLKDDTMAESIFHYRIRYPNAKVIHFNGDFHSNSRLGVVTKLKQREPNASITVITPVLIESGKKIVSIKAMNDKADYILVIEE